MIKTTRSTSEIKTIISEICNNKEFLESIVACVKQDILKDQNEKLDFIAEALNKNNESIEALRNENSALKAMVHELQTAITVLKSKECNLNKVRELKTTAPVTEKIHRHELNKIPEYSGQGSQQTRPKEKGKENTNNSQLILVDENDGFEVPKRRYRRKPEQKIGTAQDDGFGGILMGAAQPKTAWLYVGKIRNKEATELNVHNYLNQRNKEETFIVEKLDSRSSFAAFKIGAPFKMLDTLNDESFWPAGVCVRRFNFWNGQRKRFLDQTNRNARAESLRPTNKGNV